MRFTLNQQIGPQQICSFKSPFLIHYRRTADVFICHDSVSVMLKLKHKLPKLTAAASCGLNYLWSHIRPPT